jgi:hypothetical protein
MTVPEAHQPAAEIADFRFENLIRKRFLNNDIHRNFVGQLPIVNRKSKIVNCQCFIIQLFQQIV